MIFNFCSFLLLLICSISITSFSQKTNQIKNKYEYQFTRKDYQHVEPYTITLRDLGNDSVSISGSTLKLCRGGYVSIRGGKEFEIIEDGSFSLKLSKAKIQSASVIMDFELFDFDPTNLVITELHINTTFVTQMYHDGMFDAVCAYITIQSKTALTRAQQMEILNCICQRKEDCYDPKFVMIMHTI